MKKMIFISPTKGSMTFDEVFTDIVSYINEMPEEEYTLIIGTDSQLRDITTFVTAIVIHRKGKGGRYFYTKEYKKMGRTALHQRLFYEASKSLAVAMKLTEKMTENGHFEMDVQIHLDIGTKGDTKELIRDLVGMITGSGFDARIKPESYGASAVADKYTK